MARPRFHVQHFVACLNAVWQGPAGPRTHRDLEGVGFIYAVPPGTEAPEFPELWLYSRLYLTNGVVGTRRLSIEVARTSEFNMHRHMLSMSSIRLFSARRVLS